MPDVPMLLDSGADVTLIPQAYIRQLGLASDPNEVYELMGFDGRPSLAQVVHLDLLFVRRVFRGRFLLIDQDSGILGRDILNHLSVLLDGPRLNWDEQGLEGVVLIDVEELCTMQQAAGDPFKDTSSVAMNPVIKFTTLFGLLAVELAVQLTHDTSPTVSHVLAAAFFLVSLFFVRRSFYGMRMRSEG